MPSLSDGVVRLRGFEAADAAALVEIWRDPVIRARNSVPPPSVAAALEWIAGRSEWEWAVVDVASAALAGRLALKAVCERHRRAVVAVWIAPGFRGRQFCPRALRLAARHAFDRGIVRLHAECETDNEASLRALKAAGMWHEGTLRARWLREDGVALDMHVLGMVPEDLADAPPLRA